MLERLLESSAKRTRSTGGAMASVTAHTALIALAVYATAQARVVPAPHVETVRPIYFPPRAVSVPSVAAGNVGPRSTMERRLLFVDPIEVAVPAPVDLTDLVTRTGDFPTLPTAASGGLPGDAVGGDSAGTPFSPEQVEKQVALAPGNQAPRYPEALRRAGVEGAVTALFIVDASGRAEEGSLRFLRSDNLLFDHAVRAALGRMLFIPAEIGGRRVRQLVQMPFVFTLSR